MDWTFSTRSACQPGGRGGEDSVNASAPLPGAVTGRRWTVPAALALALLLLAAGVLPGLRDEEATYHMEVLTLLSSQEVWLRMQTGETDAWRTPTLYGEPRIRKPPAVLGANLLAWRWGGAAKSGVDGRVWQARLAAAGLVALAVAATVALGLRVGGAGLAWRAGLVLATMFSVIKQGHLASYDTHLLGWVAPATLAAVGLVQAGSGTRRRLWILAAGLLLTVACLVKGPIALLFVLPLPLALALGASARGPALRGLAAALALGLLGLAPWYAHAVFNVPDGLAILRNEYEAERSKFQPPWYYLNLAGLVFPWSVALGFGLWHGWRSRSLRGAATTLFWAFLCVWVVLSIPGAKRQRYIIPLLPVAALVAAAGWQALAAGAFPARAARWFRGLHLGGVAGATVAGALYLVLQPWLVARGWLQAADVLDPAPAALAALGAGLVLAVAGVGLALRRGRDGAALAFTAVWMAAAYGGLMPAYASTAHGRYADRAVAEDVGRRSTGHLHVLRLPNPRQSTVDHKFALYAGVRVTRVAPESLAGAPPPDLIIPDEEAPWAVLPLDRYRVRERFLERGRSRAWLELAREPSR